MGNALNKIMSTPFDLLLGRRTYEIFSAHWPYQDDEIGEKFNLTRERVRQIKEKAIRRLRHTSRSKALKPYLG